MNINALKKKREKREEIQKQVEERVNLILQKQIDIQRAKGDIEEYVKLLKGLDREIEKMEKGEDEEDGASEEEESEEEDEESEKDEDEDREDEENQEEEDKDENEDCQDGELDVDGAFIESLCHPSKVRLTGYC